MSDEELRELARDATPAGRLRYARALERLGRRDEAIEALLPAREDASVRVALGAAPAWRHISGDEGGTGHAHVAPIRRAPRLAWRTPGVLDPGRTERLNLDLVANPFVVVVTRHAQRYGVLDAVTGALLWERAFESFGDGRVTLEGDSVIAVDTTGVSVRDAWTGAERSRAAIPAPASRCLHGLVLSLDGEAVRAFDLAGAERWRTAVTGITRHEPTYFSAAGGRILVKMSGRAAALDEATGRVVWERRGSLICADAAAALVVLPGQGLALLAPDGADLFRFQGADPFRALGAVHLVTVSSSTQRLEAERHRFFAFDRTREGAGKQILEIAEWNAAALVRDVFVCHGRAGEGGPTLVATTVAGERLWAVPTPATAPDDVFAIAPGHRRLYTLARDGTVTCYED